MLDKNTKEAMELLGGRAVVKDGGECYILMTLREFRKMKQGGIEGLTKQELVDKINNDIAVWKISQEEERLERLSLEELEKTEDESEVRYEKA